MNSLQIDYFMKVASCGSFTTAAQSLFVSQPAVSKQVAALEEELGLQLLERSAKGVHLTHAGWLFYRLFHEFQDHFRRTLARAAEASPAPLMELRFATVDHWDIPGLIPRVIESVRTRYPNLHISLYSHDSTEILKKLQSGEVDLILFSPMFMSEKDLKDLTGWFLMPARTIALFSAAHPLAKKKGLKLEDLRDEPLLLCDRHIDIVIEKNIHLCEAHGFTPKLEHCIKREDLFLRLQAGHGFTICHEFLMDANSAAFRQLVLETPEEPGKCQEIFLYAKKEDHNPAVPIVAEEFKCLLEA